MAKLTKDAYMGSVLKKLKNSELLLRTGGLNRKNAESRDDKGLMVTFSNIITVAENHFDKFGGHDAVNTAIINFAGAGLSDVSDVRTLGAIDVTIMAATESILPWLAIDRGLSDPSATIFYNNMVAVNSAGGIAAGDIARGNFLVPNTSIDLQMAVKTLTGSGTGADLSLDFTKELMPKSVVVTLDPSGTPKVGKDYDGDGKLYFQGSALVGTVNYSTGVVKIASCTNGLAVSASVRLDSSKDGTGANILRVKADEVSVQLDTYPNDIIYEQNIHNSMYMSRIYAKASRVGAQIDQATLHFNRITDVYVEYLNREAVKLLIAAEASNDLDSPEIDISGYGVSAFAATKYDMILRLIVDMKREISSKTGLTPTVIVCGTRGKAELETHPTKWAPNPAYTGNRVNGLAGTFDGMPVYVLNYIDGVEESGYANFYMGVKLSDNSSGTLAFGEFLPLTQSGSVGNFSNPTQSATCFSSQTGFKVIQNNLAVKGRIKL